MGNEGNTWLNVPVETKETELTMVLHKITLRNPHWNSSIVLLSTARGSNYSQNYSLISPKQIYMIDLPTQVYMKIYKTKF
jgi:hypothetical protein